MLNVALVKSLYRQTSKRVGVVVKHYGGEENLHLAHRAIFGLTLTVDLPIDGQFGVKSCELVRIMFRRPVGHSETVASRIEAAFDVLHRCELALPSEALDKKYFVGRADLKFGSEMPAWVRSLGGYKPRVVLPAEAGGIFPLRRHEVPQEPFYPVFLSTPWSKMLYLIPFLQQSASPHVPLDFAYRDSTARQLFQALPTRTTCVTHGIEVECRTEYVGVESSPAPPHAGGLEHASTRPSHVFRYVIAIRNLLRSSDPDAATVALCSRHWFFMDVDKAQFTEVVGPGVVGEFPLLEPGDRHVYQSGTTLFSPRGVMHGTFQLILRMTAPQEGNESERIQQIDVRIAPTALRGQAEE